ncbi:MAG: ABC transporter ATP-binding protein [Acidimicrobiales bacterium]
MGMGANPWRMMHSLRRDPSVVNEKLPKGTVKRILRFARPFRWWLAAFLVLIVIDSLATAAGPLVYRQIIDRGILRHDTRVVVLLAVLAGGLAVADSLSNLGERWISAVVGQGVTYDMRTRVFDHINRMPLPFFTRTQTGALISRLNNDVTGAQDAFTNTLSSVVGNMLSVAVILVAMFVLSWQITLLALAALPVFLVPARWVGRKLAKLTREGYNLSSDMNSTMSERFNVSGALLVKLYGRHDDETAIFAKRAARVRDIGITQSLLTGVFFVSLLMTATLATALVYGWGGVLAAKGSLAVGTVVALAMYLVRLYAPLTQLSNVQVDVMTALVSFDRVFEVLDLQPLIAERPGAIPLERGPATVEFDHVDFSYPTPEEVSLASLESVAVLERPPRQQVLYDLSFTVAPGTLTALVGHSGAGKTTVSHLVPRLYDVSAGTVRINGVDVRDTTLESVHDVIAAVTQDAHLFHDTIRANLRYAKPDATDEELRVALEAAQILPLVDSLPDGLNTTVGDRGYRLSGGEKQRVAIARLLLKAPDVVVLDEATAHLDSESEVAVQRALATALEGRTSIVIAHRLSTVRNADQILVLDAGHIVERGTHDELLAAHGLYAELYQTQFREQGGADEVADSPAAWAGEGSLSSI